MDRITTIEVKRRTSSKLQILKHQLDFKSVDEMLSVFMAMIGRQQWSRADLLEMCLEYISGTAKSEDEMKLNLGILKEKGLPVKGKIKKKTEKTDKKEEDKA